jgi:DNA-binding NtrC family response regulator
MEKGSENGKVMIPTAVVQQYVTTDAPLSAILNNTPESRDPLLVSLRHLQECLDGKRLARDAVKSAQAVPIQGSDPDLMILMLSAWAELSCRIGQPASASVLVQQARSLLSDQSPPEIRAAALLAESLVADTTGNKVKREGILRDILRTLPTHSPRRRLYAWELAILLARQGRGTDSQSEMRELAWQGGDRYKLGRLLLAQFVNAMETGRMQQASQLMTQIKGAHLSPRDMIRIPYAGYQALLGLMLSLRQNALPPAEQAANWPIWVQVSRYLLARNTSEALRLAREEASRQLDPIFGIGFESHNLIRAELAAGAWEGSVRLLKLRHARGNRHFLDDLFMARAERLAGNARSASQHFAQALQSAEYYLARGRLDFELALACEMSQGDIVQLAQAAEKIARRSGSGSPGARQRGMAASHPATPSATGDAPQSIALQEESAGGMPPEPAASEHAATESGQQAVNAIRGRSPAIIAVRDTILRFAPLDAPVLITGETGTGKELVARALHQASPGRAQPFTAINCTSITETLLESELFGHERGAYTGADKAGKGLFEATGRGTILLDEIGDISPRLQAALLRVMETGEVRAVGSTATRQIHCRIVAATNADLGAKAQAGQFRQDLLFRLQRLGIHVAPLRERPEDIILLVRFFLDAGRRIGVHASMTPTLSQTLKEYEWPGNVRELRNVIERMRLMHSDKLHYDHEDLDLKFHGGTSPAAPVTAPWRPTPSAEAPIPGAAQPVPASPIPAPEPGLPAHHVLERGRSPMRRLDRLRDLFRTHKKLTRGEVVQILGISHNTATKDLQTLSREGLIDVVQPSASTRSRYFAIRGEPQDTTAPGSSDLLAPPLRDPGLAGDRQ